MKNLQPLSNRLAAASGSSLAQVKTQQLAREEEEKRRLRRVKGAVILAEQFLLDQGYVNALQTLQQESGLTLGTMCVADNIDLLTILGEFEEYYEWKYQRKPKLFRMRSGQDEEPVKVVTEGGEKLLVRKNKPTSASSAAAAAAASSSNAPGAYGYGTGDTTSAAAGGGNDGKLAALKPAGGVSRTLNKAKESQNKKQKDGGGGSGNNDLDFNLEGQKMQLADGGELAGLGAGGDDDEQNSFYGRALKPLPVFPTSELADLAANIMRDILVTDPAVRWKDIAELDSAKQLLKEAVVMPVKYPELFEGMVRPWKGILLFGPPGTGKTLLAKAVATECRTTFFNISASSVVSKWRGDSEKLIRMLFDLAVHYAPSTIFIDEIDSIMSARSSEGEHEGSRRMKTELLTQMDGLSKRQGGDVVFVLAASNVPWDLDTAMLRRLEKRILVTLPTAHARELIFRKLLWSKVWEPARFDWAACAADTADMSAADVDIVCREAMMRPVRKMIEKLEGFQKGHVNVQQARQELEQLKLSQESRVTVADVEASIRCTKTSVRQEDLKKYDLWTAQYGSGMST